MPAVLAKSTETNASQLSSLGRRKSARISKIKAAVPAPSVPSTRLGNQDVSEPLPPPKATKRKRKAKALSNGEEYALSNHDDEPKARKPRLKRTKTAPVIADEDARGDLARPDVSQAQDGDEDGDKPKKGRRKNKEVVEPVYVIPDVEQKTTTFRGRLGYACLNTVLRNKKPATETIFCSRTCRIDSVKKNGMEWLKSLGRQNVLDLIKVIQWNEENHIRLFRLSSEMFPFASHAIYGYTLDYCADVLAEAGALANQYGHRLTTHPGQYTQLGSPKPKVVESAVRELVYHARMLDLMGLGPDSGGGVYGDKITTLERVKENILALPENVRARLVLENDELCYNAEDLLTICEEIDVPLVFDYHHDSLFPSSISPAEIIARADKIWKRRGIKPKQHLSEQRPGAVTIMERRAHSDRCENLPPDLPDDMDLMIEAKDKEQAVLHLYRMYNLHPVIHANLRPPNPNQTKETAGRKGAKKANGTGKTRATRQGAGADQGVDEDEDAEMDVDEPENKETGPWEPDTEGRTPMRDLGEEEKKVDEEEHHGLQPGDPGTPLPPSE